MSESDQRYLLHVAAAAVRAEVEGRPRPSLDPQRWPDPTPRGAFVTIHHFGRLRGCIGTFRAVRPLPETVQEMAAAAVCDPRFVDDPLRPDELPDLDLDISLLSPLVRTNDPLSLQVGLHGIFFRRGESSGCYLPHVATEAGWDARTFLSHCCATKARTSPDAWREPDAEVYLFTTEAIHGRFCDAERGD
ncbi:MAG: AmmeMemoRadiSam system protein A [Phycisphaerae bacterium]|nr:AmmeMemoRadiSam system protein A [Phycisphaerae bacterium]NUQ46810.1 AmmeMemoRadiSam system protein A [Phycisphaerae bacterium]